MKTCKHYRYLIPKEEADELRELDKDPCEVCDIKPKTIRCESGDISFYSNLINSNKT